MAGVGLARYPFVVPPTLTIAGAAAPPEVLRAVLLTLAAGSVVLLPAFAFLFKVFNGSGGPIR